MEKHYLYTLKIKRRKERIQGLVVDMGNEWILFQDIPVDYVVDGFLLIRKIFLESFYRTKSEIFKEMVIKINKKNHILYDLLPLDSVLDLFTTFMRNQSIIQFDLHDDTVTYLGVVTTIFNKTFYIKPLLPSGCWGERESYFIDNIRTIRFNNDYINSLVNYNHYTETDI